MNSLPQPAATSKPLATKPALPLGKLLFRRAVDIFAIGLLLVVSLNAGQQISDWWRDDSPTPAVTVSPASPWRNMPVALQFGDLPVALERRPFAGNRVALQQELIALAKAAVEKAAFPTAPISDAERDWLEALDRQTPLAAVGTLGDVYGASAPLPSVVGTRILPLQAIPVSDNALIDDPKNLSASADGPARRVVCWGLAFPEGPEQWVILLFHPQGTQIPKVTSQPLMEFIPPAGRLVMNVRGADGTAWSLWEGSGSATDWWRSVQRQLVAESPQQAPKPIGDGAELRGRFRRGEQSVEVRLQKIDSEKFTVLVMVTPDGTSSTTPDRQKDKP